MSIEAVMAYLARAELSELAEAERVVTRARAAGFAFDAAELQRVLQVRELLRMVYHDEKLSTQIRGSDRPMNALLETARQSGYELGRDDIVAMLRALHTTGRELGGEELDQVAGGTRTYIPEVDDEVLVSFTLGDSASPMIIGSLWNSQDKPPNNG